MSGGVCAKSCSRIGLRLPHFDLEAKSFQPRGRHIHQHQSAAVQCERAIRFGKGRLRKVVSNHDLVPDWPAFILHQNGSLPVADELLNRFGGQVFCVRGRRGGRFGRPRAPGGERGRDQ